MPQKRLIPAARDLTQKAEVMGELYESTIELAAAGMQLIVARRDMVPAKRQELFLTVGALASSLDDSLDDLRDNAEQLLEASDFGSTKEGGILYDAASTVLKLFARLEELEQAD